MCLFHLYLGEIKNMEQLNTNYIELAKNDKDMSQMNIPLISRPTAVVYSGISEIDELIGGLHAGQLTAFIGKSSLLSTLLNRICFNTFDMFHSPTVVLDAGNRLNPFMLARFARMNMISEKELLKQVYLSRACTVYQLTDLLESHVQSLVQRIRPVTVVLTGLFSLLDDASVSHEERTQLLQLIMRQMRALAETYHVAMVLIDTSADGYDSILFDSLVNTTVQVQDMSHCPRITVTQNNAQVTVTSETVGQLCLQDFGMVI